MQRHGIRRQVRPSSSESTPHDRVTILQICSSRSLALDRPRQSALRYPAGRSTRASAYSVRRQPAPIHTPLRSRTTSAIAPPTISHSARGTQIPITHAAPPTYPFARFPCMGLFCQGVRQSGKSFVLRQFLCSISKPVSSYRPASSLTSSRAGAVKVGRRANLAACSELARPYLDSFERDGTLGAIGMTIRGEPAFGRGSVAPQPCIRWVQGPEP